jgi:branched-subunit amino acid permease
MSAESSVKYLLLAIGIAILVFGFFVAANYVFRMNSDRDWGTNVLLYDLGFVAFGVSLELLGLGLIVLGKK